MARKVKHPEHVNHERWLVSYADFITLLFATFTMLFAISNVEKEKLAAAAQSLNRAFGGGAMTVVPPITTNRVHTEGAADAGAELKITIMPSAGASRRGEGDGDAVENPTPTVDIPTLAIRPVPPAPNQPAIDVPATEPTPTPDRTAASSGSSEGGGDSEMAARLRQLLEAYGLQGKVDVREEQRGTVVSLSEAAFFETGEVMVKPSSLYQLDRIINALRDQNFEIRVEGHTDNTPIVSGRYKSNLELSTLRAANIVDFMIREYHFPPQLLSSAGYGEWKPVADNATPEGRQKNRRVDLVILNQRMQAQEPPATYTVGAR